MTTAVETSPEKKLTREEKKELALEKAKVTDELAFGVLLRGLQAEKITTEYKDGVQVERRDPDMVIQHKFFDSWARIKGYIRSDATVESTMNFNLTVSERADIKKRLRKVIDV